MKKVLFTLALITCFVSPLFAEVIFAPQWSEFCPPSFLTVTSTVKAKDKKYWYERRIQFEESLERCNQYTGADLKACYGEIRVAEHNKNKVWDRKVQQSYEDLDRLIESNRQINQYNLIRDVVKTIAK